MTETQPTRGAHSVVLHNIRWETYEALLKDHEGSSSPRFTYDEGMLEIMSPLRFHESTNRAVAYLVDIVLDEWHMDCDNFGSLTLKAPVSKKGVEPDTCFYIANVGALDVVNTPDLEQGDPPPDLVVEIDDTSLSVAKLPIYAAFGVPEIWRVRKASVDILLLSDDTYITGEQSTSLPGLTPAILRDLLAEREALTRFDWAEKVREWATQNAPSNKNAVAG